MRYSKRPQLKNSGVKITQS
jgi:hypothetical protein